MITTKLTHLVPIDFPVIQAGMIWVSGGKLAAASANAGIMGVIGAGSMSPEVLRGQIKKARYLTPHHGRLAVNLPLLYSRIDEQIDVALEEGIRIFITSAGSPKKFTSHLKSHGALVMHVVSNPELALKCEENGVDVVIAEGFEAGGHNGRDELTTLTLIPQVLNAVKIPVIAAGGIATGQGVAAMLALGCAGVQIGSRFIVADESSAHENFKNLILESKYDSTKLMMKKHVPVRLLKNDFFRQVEQIENQQHSDQDLISLLGKGRAKAGMHDGDLVNGELEIGQICALIKKRSSTHDIVHELKKDFFSSIAQLHSLVK